MQKGLLLILGLAVCSLVINIYPTEFVSAQRSPSKTRDDFLALPYNRFIPNENKSDMEERFRLYDDRGSEDRQRRRKRLRDLSRVGYSSGRGGGYVSHLEAEQALRQMIPIRREFGDRRGEISDFMHIAMTYALRMRHREAVENFKIAIELARSTGDLRIESQVLTNTIATTDLFNGSNVAIDVYEYLIRYDSSFDWIPARLEYLKAIHPSSFDKIGNSYSARKEYLKAIEAYKKSVSGFYNRLLEKSEKNNFFYEYKSMAEIQLKMGLLYRIMGKENEANNAFNNSLDSYSKLGINREYNDLNTRSLTDSLIDEPEMWDGLTTLAIAKNSDRLISKVIQAQIIRYKKSDFVLKRIGDSYSRTGEYKTAIYYYDQYLKRHNDKGFTAIDTELALARAYANIGDKTTSLKYYLLVYNKYNSKKRAIYNFHVTQEYRAEQYKIIGKQPTNLFYISGAWVLVEIGNFHKNIGEIDKSISFYKQAANILDNSVFAYGGWGGDTPQASILSDEDDIGKLITETSKEPKTETTNQDSKK